MPHQLDPRSCRASCLDLFSQLFLFPFAAFGRERGGRPGAARTSPPSEHQTHQWAANPQRS